MFDWRDLALKAAEQINDENWIQGSLWQSAGTVFETFDELYGNMQPVKACVVGHLYWVAQDQGLTFEEANTLVAEVADEVLANDTDDTWRLTGYNDTYGRTSHEVAERLRRLATT